MLQDQEHRISVSRPRPQSQALQDWYLESVPKGHLDRTSVSAQCTVCPIHKHTDHVIQETYEGKHSIYTLCTGDEAQKWRVTFESLAGKTLRVKSSRILSLLGPTQLRPAFSAPQRNNCSISHRRNLQWVTSSFAKTRVQDLSLRLRPN